MFVSPLIPGREICVFSFCLHRELLVQRQQHNSAPSGYSRTESKLLGLQGIITVAFGLQDSLMAL